MSAGAGRLDFIPPMMPTLVAKPPQGDDWFYEAKFDVYRSQLISNLNAYRARWSG
ncbi:MULTISPECIES: hypothetical protein [unclassified Mesorhizobium]|uniref:hypothetical protein n=1 Tax=unclassified Mesorhizobium TaxID=325217 RepID=UPI0013E39E4A|nr:MULTISPECIES: hypothetical protein [unclassified Mesorhizobium]